MNTYDFHCELKMNMPVYNSFMTAVGGHVCVAASFEVVPGYLVFLELNCNKKKKLDHFDAEITTRL